MAPSLLDYLGEMTWYLDTFVDRREGGIEVVGGVHKSVMPCNWKFPAENFCGDAYHAPWSHASVMGTTNPSYRDSVGKVASPGNGHGVIVRGPDTPPMSYVPEILAYERSIIPEVEARLGPRRKLISPNAANVFPNLSFFKGHSATFRVWHPRGPGKTEWWSWLFMDKAAPQDVKEEYRLAGIRGLGSAGVVEQDDVDNWQACTDTSRGVVARRYPLSMEMGIGHEGFDEDLGAWASDSRISEANHRHFYRRWERLMSGDYWERL